MNENNKNERVVRNYAPCNLKSMVAFLFNQMDMLARGEIDSSSACAQAKLAQAINRAYEAEMKNALVQIKLKEVDPSVQPRLKCLDSKIVD